jgi:hypothetical protein
MRESGTPSTAVPRLATVWLVTSSTAVPRRDAGPPTAEYRGLSSDPMPAG